ncbi:hypothetical protein DL96DRAFT_1597878 [Flagelloscypha sp. PMI_526]|nr:hypothetical protein DL96DRAFT_1597878 [Flagelloscypha sp. PMI_526]
MVHAVALPYDVLRFLVEFAASCDLGIAATLSMVSRECQRWSDVHLFRFLVWTGSRPKSYFHLLDTICDDNDASLRLLQARQHVRALTWRMRPPDQIPLKKLCRTLTHLPNLVQLCLWENYIPELALFPQDYNFNFDLVFPKLKRIYTCSNTLSSTTTKSFNSGFWSTITYLQISPEFPLYSPHSPFSDCLLVGLSNLTHLAIGEARKPPVALRSNPSESLQLVVSRVQSSLPPNDRFQLCLLSIESSLCTEETGPQIDALRLGEVDHRIVLWSMSHFPLSFEGVVHASSGSDDVFDVWTGCPDEKVTFWEAGEAIQAQRKRFKV